MTSLGIKAGLQRAAHRVCMNTELLVLVLAEIASWVHEIVSLEMDVREPAVHAVLYVTRAARRKILSGRVRIKLSRVGRRTLYCPAMAKKRRTPRNTVYRNFDDIGLGGEVRLRLVGQSLGVPPTYENVQLLSVPTGLPGRKGATFYVPRLNENVPHVTEIQYTAWTRNPE
jgi:hypothetical protein